MPFLGSFTGSKSFGGFGGGGGSLADWITDNSFSLISGTDGQPSAVYEKVFTGTSGGGYNATQADITYTLTAPPIPVNVQVVLVAGGGGAPGGLGGGGDRVVPRHRSRVRRQER